MEKAIAYSTYPEDWLRLSLGRRYFTDDPVLAACERTAAPLLWSELPQRMLLTERQKHILRSAAEFGLTEGLSIPANIPGEPRGSCSFGAAKGGLPSAEARLAAHWVGAFAFEVARRIVGLGRPPGHCPRLTPRQFDCLVLAGQGKSDGVIAQLLGLSCQTVHEHIELAKRHYGVATRVQLVTCCLADGLITYADLLEGWGPTLAEKGLAGV